MVLTTDNAVLLLNKSVGWTSNQALQKIKHLLQAKKAGHTGSLDPFATGLLPVCLGKATKIAQKLIDAIEQPLRIKNQTIRISTSIGLTFYPDDGENAGLLMQNADRAMYAAKDAGGSTYMLYSSELESTWRSRTFIINELEQALNDNQICVYYQPVIHAQNGTICAEALVRWQHPERGLISPMDFLPVAERMGLIGRIDDHVFAGVCQQIRQWRQQGLGDIAVSINRSAQGFGTQEGRLDWINHLQQLDLEQYK